ncbi:MAG TPA: FtsX-like permease family protein [Terriglobales bacterium]|nr:FtsX-like permease family protein [Terriglobales bacterium]
MTLTRFATRNAFRNKRRASLTVLSMAFSLLLLTLMMTIWRAFYIDEGSAESAQRLIVRNKVSLVFFLPGYYREKIRALPGVTKVVNQTWFGGQYKDQKPENMFAQFGTDPQEFFDVYKDFHIPADQLQAWQKDRAGCVVDADLAKKHDWKIGDRIFIKGLIFPLNLELTVRGIFSAPTPSESIYFNSTYLEEGYQQIKGRAGFFGVLADSPEDVPKVAKEIDEQFKNVERPTKTESEHAFQLGWIAMMGNVKAFILSICLAVVFAILLVSANTMAMSIRERTREVALLKTLGFTQGRVLGLFVSEAMALAVLGGIFGTLVAAVLIRLAANTPGLNFFLAGVHVGFPTMLVALLVAATVGFVSAFLPAYNASRRNIVEGLRHIG